MNYAILGYSKHCLSLYYFMYVKRHSSVSFKCNIFIHLKSFYCLYTVVILNREVENICPEIVAIILNFFPLIIELETISLSPVSKMTHFIFTPQVNSNFWTHIW